MTSISSAGSSIITLQFNLALNIDVAEQEVQQSINASGTFLPADLPTPPIYSKINPADTPILTLALSSSSLPLSAVEDLADTRLARRSRSCRASAFGVDQRRQKPAVRIQANPTALASRGPEPRGPAHGAHRGQRQPGEGEFRRPHQSYQIGANDQLMSSADYRPLVVAYRNGAPIKLIDVAKVIDDVENVRQAAWMNNAPAVILNIQRQPGANIITVVDRIQGAAPAADLDAAVVDRHPDPDRPHHHHPRIRLRRPVRAAADGGAGRDGDVPVPAKHPGHHHPERRGPAVARRTFGAMYLFGYSLNNLTLMALTISTGFVVDDAILMIENIVRYVEQGETPLEAALKGAEQIGFTIVSLTISLIAVLIPLLFMGTSSGGCSGSSPSRSP